MYIVIGGGGLLGGTLAIELAANRHDVVVIEANKQECEDLSARGGAMIVHGSATDVDMLERAGIAKADVAVACMRTDGDNLAFSLLSKRSGVPRIFARMRKSQNKQAYELAGATKAYSVLDIFVQQLLLEIEQPALKLIATFGEGKANIATVRVADSSRVCGQSVAELTKSDRFPDECVIAGIFREETDEFIFPRGSRVIRAGDQVFLAASTKSIRRAAAIFGGKK